MSEGCVTRSCSEVACEGIAMVARGIVAELCFVLGWGECVCHVHIYRAQTCLSDSVCYCQCYLCNLSV